MGVSPYPCCAECEDWPINEQQSDLVITSDCPCVNGEPTPTMGNGVARLTASGSGPPWSWAASNCDANASECDEPNCRVFRHNSQTSYYWANPSVQLSCVTEGEHCGQWRVSMGSYISDGVDGGTSPFDHACSDYSDKYLTTELSVDENGYLVGKATLDCECDCGSGHNSCTVTLEWKPPV